MKRSMLSVLVLGCLAAFPGSAPAQSAYTFTSFDVPFTGGSNTKAFAINARGDIVGRYFDSTTGGNPRGFLRNSDGTYASPIDVPVANSGTVARGINSRGDIAGKYFDPVNPNNTHGFLLTAAGAFTSFDVTLSGAIAGSTIGHSINNPGAIVGHYAAPTAWPGCPGVFPLVHGFLRNTDGSFTAVDYPGGNVVSTFAQGLDDSGDLVGSYITTSTPTINCTLGALINTLVTAHAFLRDPKGNYTTIDPPASVGAKEATASRINDAGDIAGAYTTIQATFAQLLGDVPIPSFAGGVGAFFVLSGNGTFTSIPTPFTGAGLQAPLGINPRGNLVGFYQDGAGDHGFMATK